MTDKGASKVFPEKRNDKVVRAAIAKGTCLKVKALVDLTKKEQIDSHIEHFPHPYELKPTELFWHHYNPYYYADVVPAINQPLRCPFNPSHIYRNGSHGSLHLIRCSQNNPKLRSYYDICDFNSSHYVLKSQMKEHLNTCQAYQLWAYEQVLCGLPLTLTVDPLVATEPKKNEPIVEVEDEDNKIINYDWDEVDC